MKNFKKFKFKEFNIKNTLIALACTLVFAQANAMEIDPNPFSGLPDEVNLQILQNLENRDLQATACTDRNLNRLVNDRTIQKQYRYNQIKSYLIESLNYNGEENTLGKEFPNKWSNAEEYVIQLDDILSSLNAINQTRQNLDFPDFMEKEYQLLLQKLNQYNEELSGQNQHQLQFLFNILSKAIEQDANHAFSYLIQKLEKAEYKPNDDSLIDQTLTNCSWRCLSSLIEHGKTDINSSDERDWTALDNFMQRVDREKLSNPSSDESKTLQVLRHYGAKTFEELQEEKRLQNKRSHDDLDGETETQGREKR